MAKRNKKEKRSKRVLQRCLEDSDLVWLAERFSKESKRNPELTVKKFAERHGIPVKLISRYIVRKDVPGMNTVTVWHGTTVDRAKSIVEEGFKVQSKRGKKIWFTQRSSEANSIAKNRARQRSEEPVVFRCEINLDKYSEFDKANPNHFAFKHSHITKEVIRGVSGLKIDKDKPPKEKKEKQELIDVVITNTSGKLGILYWINSYLELKGEDIIDENHTAVKAIHKWVDEQYAEGRDEPISNEEMLSKMKEYFKP